MKKIKKKKEVPVNIKINWYSFVKSKLTGPYNKLLLQRENKSPTRISANPVNSLLIEPFVLKRKNRGQHSFGIAPAKMLSTILKTLLVVLSVRIFSNNLIMDFL